ncbi:Lrp/AsnC family transcriptional regulator [Mycobacteroides chelonae]|uniref:Lrp/AsnC family transcriptional regulator n=1 Tax=Mycobacteroides chelonae TaxID=1774 RepID=UPI0008A99879|nr:Lrp/AsnC family transcriptional regulator [Mycobacteroides chelonae]OHU63020.1 hypothetical protein BKG85_16430 [Mycobacteroides chelonae]
MDRFASPVNLPGADYVLAGRFAVYGDDLGQWSETDVPGRDCLGYIGLIDTSVATAKIAQCPDVPFVSVTTGVHGVAAEVRASSAWDMDRTIGHLRALDGVVSVDTLTYVEVVRDVAGPVGEVDIQVDQIDLSLLQVLQDDGRASFVDLAGAVGISAAGARRRVMRLITSQVVRIGAVVRHSGKDRQTALGFGVRLAGDHKSVIEKITDLPSVIFVARTLGRFDLLGTMRASSAGQLAALLDSVRSMAGVNAVDSWTHLQIVKESYSVSFDVHQ